MSPTSLQWLLEVGSPGLEFCFLLVLAMVCLGQLQPLRTVLHHVAPVFPASPPLLPFTKPLLKSPMMEGLPSHFALHSPLLSVLSVWTPPPPALRWQRVKLYVIIQHLTQLSGREKPCPALLSFHTWSALPPSDTALFIGLYLNYKLPFTYLFLPLDSVRNTMVLETRHVCTYIVLNTQ